MIYKLPAPVLEQTHAKVRSLEILIDERVVVGARYGTLDEQGEFVEEPRIGVFYRAIEGPELAAFLTVPLSRGLPESKAGNFRSDDLAAWFDKHGIEKSTWEPTAALDTAAAVGSSAQPA